MTAGAALRVVVLGGAGHFGGRIVRSLRADPRIELLVAGRTARTPQGADDVRSVVLDLADPRFADLLGELAPRLVINCTGPFQGQDYRVARAALAAGAHYLDLADGREFVAGFSQAVSPDALRAGRAAITGASTLPGLSSAVVQQLGRDLARLSCIEIVIAPGQRAPRGKATLEGVLSYLGRPFPVWRNGKWCCAWGWMDLRRVRLDIGTRLAAACDVPDLALFPEHFAGVQTVTFHAALEIAPQHIALWTLAAMRRIGVPLRVERWAVTLDRLAGLFDALGADRGGMSVKVTGSRPEGGMMARSWQLVAPAAQGPEIPCMPAILLARLLARGEALKSGAYPCIGLLRLKDFDPEFQRWGMVTRTTEGAL